MRPVPARPPPILDPTPPPGPPLTRKPASPDAIEVALRRELYLFALYRTLEASLLALVVFSPFGGLLSEPRDRFLAVTVAIAYLPMALALLLASRRDRSSLAWQACVGVGVDIIVAALITHAIPGVAPGVAMMLLFNVGAAALLVPLPLAMSVAAAAGCAVVGEFLWSTIGGGDAGRPFSEVLMFSVSFFAIATVSNLLGRQMRESHAVAGLRAAEAANLNEINGLIIRRMRTGVLLIDGSGFVRLANEAALMLLGDVDLSVDGKPRNIRDIAPDLAARLQAWRHDGVLVDAPILLGETADQVEILPRFARLLVDGETTLVFLDDTSMVSRRAESLTLAAMGRFSASLAHEIRNPLAAISYATQLLEESNNLDDSDRRLLQIVHQQCMRTNGIVESVLGLARRERAQPENIDLVIFARRFLDEYLETVPPDVDEIKLSAGVSSLPVLVDPRHLQQVLTVLLQNSLRYGRMPGQPARVILRVEKRGDTPVIEVLDRGPGIPDGVLAQLFRPFFTTSEHGTGLGLYIARELCRANGANLEYVSVPAGGACFRLTLPGPDALPAA
ncbi:HAMP domain-containing sensor histidine kinase [Luteimonas lutimaris]|uniref:histidine kinase n=1 Tax=Luteimonas lutimaris TaxID=698645 RepID=A0ABP7M812_9GAMM